MRQFAAAMLALIVLQRASSEECAAGGTCRQSSSQGYRARTSMPKLCSLQQSSSYGPEFAAVFNHMDDMMRKSLDDLPPAVGDSFEGVLHSDTLNAAGEAVRHTTAASYLYSWVENLSKAAHATLGVTLSLGQSLAQRLPVIWSDAVFEVRPSACSAQC
jgi:hypothetical protein